MNLQGKHIIVTGGTGLVGSELTRQLQAKGCEVGILTRSPKKGGAVRHFGWDVRAKQLDPEALEWADGIVHLAGAGIADKRWSPERKKEIYDSRVDSTRMLYESLKSSGKKLDAFVSASAIGYYGFKTTDHKFVESDPPAEGFLAELCRDWEEEAMKVDSLGIRTVCLRVGVVLSAEGGALPEMARPMKFFVGAPLGSGKQYMPWIHISDMAGQFVWALENDQAKGAYNGVSPDPLTNKEFTKVLAKVMKRPMLAPNVPPFVIELIMGKEVAALALHGSRISSQKTENDGFQFRFRTLQPALQDLLG